MNCISTCVFLCFLLLLHDMNKGHYPPEYSWQRCSRNSPCEFAVVSEQPRDQGCFWALGSSVLGVLGPRGFGALGFVRVATLGHHLGDVE